MLDKPQSMLAISIVAMTMVTSSWLARLYVRTQVIKAWGSDDWVMTAALVSFLCFLISEICGLHYGTGQHIQDLEPARAQKALEFWYICEVFYAPSTTLLKVSVGLFFLRIVRHKYHKWGILFFIAGSLFFGTIYVLMIIFQCHPVSFWWDLNPNAKGSCIAAEAFTVMSFLISALNSSADFFFAALPILLVWETTMNKRTRFIVCILLGMASVACVATLVRLKYLHFLNVYKHDFLYNTVPVAICSTAEVTLGITAGCCACLRPLFQRWLDRARTTKGVSGPGGSDQIQSVPKLRTFKEGEGNDEMREQSVTSWAGRAASMSKANDVQIIACTVEEPKGDDMA